MKAKAYRLLVVAHPDDESIFFGGLVQRERSLPWKVICVTDGNADGRGEERHGELLAAAKTVGLKSVEHWEFKDLFNTRLPVEELERRLRALAPPKEVFTHGPIGEYGHAHHQDVCLAVYRAFPKLKIFSPAWNCEPDKVITLKPAEFKKKTKTFAQIYRKETERFINVLPNSAVETFARFSLKEVENLVGYFRGEAELDKKALKKFAWAHHMLPSLKEKLATRLF
jgi:LmbE family N-acetylglucosaminyl deacetylase